MINERLRLIPGPFLVADFGQLSFLPANEGNTAKLRRSYTGPQVHAPPQENALNCHMAKKGPSCEGPWHCERSLRLADWCLSC